MNLDEIRSILELVREHELSEFELERDGLKIRIRKDAIHQPSLLMSGVPAPAGTATLPAPAAAAPARETPPSIAEPAPEAGEEADYDLAVVSSPIVGTFYRSAEPASPPFVEVGETVKKGQVLCIIEAMKLMNEIESEYDGDLVKIYVENGQPVQYGERLFALKIS
ncbi:MAG: acetyl-CoA carboxylase biotin carboxyl carrier protein [Acidobacteria bacterium]|nr:acetyl-CoA carboxylase biotin carboxyl carrier protein [Acidobacteriota bacterium]